jgi:hypothetical protein
MKGRELTKRGLIYIFRIIALYNQTTLQPEILNSSNEHPDDTSASPRDPLSYVQRLDVSQILRKYSQL